MLYNSDPDPELVSVAKEEEPVVQQSSNDDFIGVVEERSVHDIFFFIIFIAAVVCFVWWGIQYISTVEPLSDSVSSFAVAKLGEYKTYIWGAIGCVFVLCLVYILLIRFIAKPLIYLSIIFGIVALGYVGFLCMFDDYVKTIMPSAHIIVAVVIWFIDLVIVFVVLFNLKNVAFTATMMEASCEALLACPSTLILGGVLLLFGAGIILFGLLFLYSITIADESMVLPMINNRVSLFIIILFIGLWITAFLRGLFTVSTAGTIANFAFARTSEDIVVNAFSMCLAALIFHAGSICIGAFLIALVELLQILLEKARRETEGNNKVVQAIFCCLQCCLTCIHGCLDWITRYVYIFIAMYGESFWNSAKGVHDILSQYFLTIALVDSISKYVYIVTSALGGAGFGLLSRYLWIQNGYPVNSASLFIWFGLGAFVFILLYLATFLIAAAEDTLMVCYAEDRKRNTQTGNYALPAEIHAVFDSSSNIKQTSPSV
eukprot:TRINITY_DN3100_c0_g1_i3.p1 TRINITY_DN3100_c0_g1~~TRINITY_DN3100_c0_g1_i3.p1  ORF type:complete len:488 (+),score=116.69 TRINITY_DN3100_c0_g1_i3:32-1495(+)